MKSNKIHRSDTGLFSKQQLDMVYDQAIYKDFISQPFSIDAFEDQMNMKLKQYPEEFRKVLRDSLINQYDRVEITTSTASNIDSILDNKTYTITTGHQLSLFTGPLYFIIKIVHVIKLCKKLSKKYPQHRFVPVYWMASEDHDFKEIQSFHVFNKTITWNTNQKGPVGRFDLSGLDEVKTQLTELFVNHPDSEVMNLIDQLDGETYADVVRGLVNALFGSDGLVILDGDDVELKQLFAPIVQKELDEQFSFKEVLKLNDTLSALNVKLQVVPRETNLFYIENG
ncbi:bacillithiol biosynthesis cysteine-adding enzyme BshC, partial [Crocinitomicaceae bacterium]|nr:bacillithiol biosynthesis cysteine-adding enzyme BshC [Crocinitomicaceae bacterium]